MSVVEFWNQIHESGSVSVATEMPVESRELIEAISATESDWRLELAFEPPPLRMDAAVWGALRMYRACQFLVYREIDAATITREFEVPCPFEPSPQTCYSVDLAFRVLPEVFNLARGLSHDDPLVKGLHELGRHWPLSSVGMKDFSEVDISPFIDQPSLQRLYIDRIIERNDASRLADARVKKLVFESLSSHPHLAPRIFESASSSPAIPAT